MEMWENCSLDFRIVVGKLLVPDLEDLFRWRVYQGRLGSITLFDEVIRYSHNKVDE